MDIWHDAINRLIEGRLKGNTAAMAMAGMPGWPDPLSPRKRNWRKLRPGDMEKPWEFSHGFMVGSWCRNAGFSWVNSTSMSTLTDVTDGDLNDVQMCYIACSLFWHLFNSWHILLQVLCGGVSCGYILWIRPLCKFWSSIKLCSASGIDVLFLPVSQRM